MHDVAVGVLELRVALAPVGIPGLDGAVPPDSSIRAYTASTSAGESQRNASAMR